MEIVISFIDGTAELRRPNVESIHYLGQFLIIGWKENGCRVTTSYHANRIHQLDTTSPLFKGEDGYVDEITTGQPGDPADGDQA